ncbi:MAG TPA: hypothetical protein VF420_13380 [Casimicrobiaceae bacterium]
MRFEMQIPSDEIQQLAGHPAAGAMLTASVCRRLLDATVVLNRILLRLYRMRGRPLPLLYASRVVYRREPNPNNLVDCVTLYKRGWGDCKHLTAWRLAELAEHGFEAHPLIYWRLDEHGAPFIYHAELRHGPRNGHGPREDPSRFLGM